MSLIYNIYYNEQACTCSGQYGVADWEIIEYGGGLKYDLYRLRDKIWWIRMSYRTHTNFRGTYISRMPQIRDFIFEDHRILYW